ncbi:sugar O-acetyltransferase [Actinobacillus equuli]|uniref:sugar O-acetyltransferase n=1 Tax=Actinobacillus equuli TaxID=718 RepID=UPI00244171A5|nr:sugar O-acetyltransferase [Actinobacillus equuli]WGE41271.1 sugar O-acetyltransferase [Actinobacillus equuli subsp. haemolyticus]WGE80450.1 sugar O-acetyltransferase [Actinobacillus equuli subsp. haemolyticus]WGE84641.1 sugar O-acetyltransferase [Actinobacillus equuli subsp. haemolyticus]
MTEQEKMCSGNLYNPADSKLKQDRLNAREIVFQLNQLAPSQQAEKTTLFNQLFHTAKTEFHIELPFRCDYGYNIKLGDNFYANYNCTMLDCAPISIGNNVMFAPNVSLFTAAHPIDPELRNSGIEFAMPIVIGNNVWIGGNSVVMPNVTIGNNVVIGAGSVVTKDIPDNCIAVGNPCRVLRQINQQDKIYYFKDRKF